MLHSDDKVLVLPPTIAQNQIVIIPIIFEKTKEETLSYAKKVFEKLQEHRPLLDNRDEHSPGYKFNEWELKGIPIRIEVGPKDLEKNQVVVVRRDNGTKEIVKLKDLDEKKIGEVLKDIKSNLLKKAEKNLRGAIVSCPSLSSVKKAVSEKKIAFAPL